MKSWMSSKSVGCDRTFFLAHLGRSSWPVTRTCNKTEVHAFSRTSRSLSVMRSVSWRASGQWRTVPVSHERQGARLVGVLLSVHAGSKASVTRHNSGG